MGSNPKRGGGFYAFLELEFLLILESHMIESSIILFNFVEIFINLHSLLFSLNESNQAPLYGVEGLLCPGEVLVSWVQILGRRSFLSVL